jgi:hypothetical protein
MKWISIVLINLITFSAFSQECSWNGLSDIDREEVTSFLIQRARAKVDSFLIEKGMVKTSEDPMVIEITPESDTRTDVASARYHYKFKTEKGDEISTDPNQKNHGEQNYFNRISFNGWIERDQSGNPKRMICNVYFKILKIPLFNLTLDDYFLGRLELFDYTDIFEFNIPLSTNLN